MRDEEGERDRGRKGEGEGQGGREREREGIPKPVTYANPSCSLQIISFCEFIYHKWLTI